MKWADLIRLAWNNLKQRKLRSFLTMTAVAIGVTSILVMVSIGAGISAQQDAWLESLGDFRKIEVYSMGDVTLDDKILETIKGMEHAGNVSAKMSLYPDDVQLSLSAGANERYVMDWANITAMDLDMLETLGFEIAEPSDLKRKPDQIEVYVGDSMAYSFRDTLAPDGKNYRTPGMEDSGMVFYDGGYSEASQESEGEAPFFDSVKTPMNLNVDTYEGNRLFSRTLVPKGRLKGNLNNYESVNGIIMSLDDAIALQKDIARASGKPAPKTSYESIVVLADEIENVSDLEKQIKDMGFYTSSYQSMREEAQNSSRQIQLMLGGIGAISLFVAAIGISNTMIMTIQERTRELGIMKALGCRTSDIQAMVLCEAGIIGFLGGMAGLILSEIISIIINCLVSPVENMNMFFKMLVTPSMQTSHISISLALFALIFSIGIGLISGFAPARRAMKISALEAIRHN